MSEKITTPTYDPETLQEYLNNIGTLSFPNNFDLASLTTLQFDENDALKGSGVFDILMMFADKHITREFVREGINGSDYADWYLKLISTVFERGSDLVISLTKLPYEILDLLASIRLKEAELLLKQWELEYEYPLKLELLQAQIDKMNAEVLVMQQQLEIAKQELEIKKVELEIKEAELAMMQCQSDLMCQKVITEKAQVDGTIAEEGSSIWYQNQVLEAQIQGYKDDISVKKAKLAIDVWVVQRNTDDALLAPTQLGNDEIGEAWEAIPDYNVDTPEEGGG